MTLTVHFSLFLASLEDGCMAPKAPTINTEEGFILLENFHQALPLSSE